MEPPSKNHHHRDHLEEGAKWKPALTMEVAKARMEKAKAAKEALLELSKDIMLTLA